MEAAPTQRTKQELDDQLDQVLQSPATDGRLDAIYVRPKKGERLRVPFVNLSVENGIEGDRWSHDHWRTLPDGRSDPRAQVSLMNTHVLRLVAGDEESMRLAGDNLIIDLDLSKENVPTGTQLQIGDEAIVEISNESHTGCAYFSQRYGVEAKQFVNSPRGKSLNLRGLYARIIRGGIVRVGDRVRKV